MKKAQYFRFVSCVISVILCCLVGFAFVDHKAAADEKNILEDGTYTMQSFLRSASSDQASMGNAGIVQPIEWNLYSKSRMQGTEYKIRKD